ncbi:hypothetical protein Cfor_02752, partial [Coptotermes formosanus]
LEDLYCRYTNNAVFVLDTADTCGDVEGLVSLFGSPAGRALVAAGSSENSGSSSSRLLCGSRKKDGRLISKTRRKERRKSSTELYREAAALLGLTCSMNDSCRCIECQSHYFDFDDDDRRTDTGLAAGTPALLDHVLSHPMTCSLQ